MSERASKNTSLFVRGYANQIASENECSPATGGAWDRLEPFFCINSYYQLNAVSFWAFAPRGSEV